MRVTVIRCLALLFLVAACFNTPAVAFADGYCGVVSCTVKASKPAKKPHSSPNHRPSTRKPSTGGGQASRPRDIDLGPTTCRQNTCFNTAPATGILQPPGAPAGAAPARPTITPAQAAAVAVAQLRLPTVAPGIGPAPAINQWKIAAVGYPLWLWADGPTTVGPVSNTVAGLTVSLRAQLTSVSYQMGDGHTLRCAGPGTPWTSAVRPGQKSPNCGYTYQQPSLPKGPYTVTARTTWAVTWTAGGGAGVIDVDSAPATTELPVGELQVLVR